MLKERLDVKTWGRDLSRFSEINQNRLTRIEVIGQVGDVMRDYWLENGLPLMGIDVDTKVQDAMSIQIMLASKDKAGHFTHVVSNAKCVTVLLGYEGQFDALEIEDVKGAKTILRFESNETAAAA